MMMVAFVLLCTMAVPATLFPIIYAFARWYRSTVGKGLMITSVAMLLLVDISIVFTLFGIGSGPVAEAVQVGVFALLNVGLWLQLAVLIRVQFRARRSHTTHR